MLSLLLHKLLRLNVCWVCCRKICDDIPLHQPASYLFQLIKMEHNGSCIGISFAQTIGSLKADSHYRRNVT